MAEQPASSTFLTLRVVTQRLATTSAQRLPHVIPYLTTILSKSEDFSLAAQANNETRNVSEGPVLVHKLKTQISALLQDRSPEARYSAVVLAKATVEVGGWNVLQGVSPWVKYLIGIIGRSNSAITKCLSVITLTRVFILTQKYPSLVREVTTPCLTEFVTVCLNTLKDRKTWTRNDVLLVTMQAFAELLPYHPTSFRPFSARIKALCVFFVAPTPSETKVTDDIYKPSLPVSESARRLYVLLSISAPKHTSSEAWARNIFEIIECTNRTANLVFRTLVDDVRVSLDSQDLDGQFSLESIVQDSQIKEPGLPAWTGMSAGIERLDGLLQTLMAFISTPSAVALVLPIGELLRAIERILSALPPTKDMPVRTRPETSREERETLFVSLPYLHVSAINLCSLLLSRLGRDAVAISYSLLDQVLWTLERAPSTDRLKRAAYTAISKFLELFGASLLPQSAAGLTPCIKLCCEDLLPSGTLSSADTEPWVTKAQNGSKRSALGNSDQYPNIIESQSRISYCPVEVRNAAIKLLSSALTHLPGGFISSTLRQKIDRAAILSNIKEIMFASAMNPPTSLTKATPTSSLMPFLARSFPDHLAIEALIRPRMPPLQVQQGDGFGHALDTRHDEPDDDIVDPDDSQTSIRHEYLPATESKRQRQPSEENRTEAEDLHLNGSGTVTEKQPPSPKRQKVVHEDPVQALTGASSNSYSAETVHQPIEERLRVDQPPEDSLTRAAEVEPIGGSSPLDSTIPPVPSGLELQGFAHEVKPGIDKVDDGDSDSDNFVMPVLEMDSGIDDDDDDKEDEEEEESESGGNVRNTMSD